MGQKVIYIDVNFIADRYKNAPKDGDAFYTMGFGGLYSRQFKKYNTNWEVECWKTDSRIQKSYEKKISGVLFKVYPGIRIPFFGFFSNLLGKKLKEEISMTLDLIVNISSLKHLLFHQLAPLCKSVPLVVQGHGETTAKDDVNNRKGFLRKLLAFINTVFEKRAIKSVDLYYSLDARLKKSFFREFNGEFLVQTTGVNPDMFKPINKNQAKKELQLDTLKNYILFVGRLDYTKRVDLLLDVWNEIRDTYPNWQLLLAGNIPGMPLATRAKDVGAIIKGRILQTELYKYLSATDVYVLAGLRAEFTYGGVGMLPVQALFCETPVVGVTVRNIPAEIRNDVGIYTETKDELKSALLDIINGEKKFSNLREKAIDIYSWQVISTNTEKKYTELLKCKK